jgi:hypothetical protein
MYNPVSLYYLNQLGITPWIKKETLLNQNHSKLIVLYSANTTKKAELLWNKIISYLSIEGLELSLHCDNFLSELKMQLNKQIPMAILVFGINSDSFPTDIVNTCPIMYCPSMEYLLNNPLDKKQVLKNLELLRTLFFKQMRS